MAAAQGMVAFHLLLAEYGDLVHSGRGKAQVQLKTARADVFGLDAVEIKARKVAPQMGRDLALKLQKKKMWLVSPDNNVKVLLAGVQPQ